MKDFEKLYTVYADMVYKIAFVYCGNAADSEDVLQEVFMRYLYSSPRFHDDEHEKAWLIRVTQNVCYNMLKSPMRKACDIESLSIAVDMPEREQKLDLLAKVIALPAKYKSVVLLYYYYDYSVAEIAHILNISLSAVKMRLKRSREQLKTDLEGYENE